MMAQPAFAWSNCWKQPINQLQKEEHWFTSNVPSDLLIRLVPWNWPALPKNRTKGEIIQSWISMFV